MQPSFICDETTVKLAAVSRVPKITVMLPAAAVEALCFPQLYILAPTLRGGIKYALETAPAWAFDAWVARCTNGGILFDHAQAAKILRIDRERWSVAEKWQIINALAEADITVPLYSRAEAERAMIAMEVERVH